MKISVIGSGYVGLVTGACFAEVGNSVICVDIDEKKIDGLKNGVIPIYEPGLDKLVVKNFQNGHLSFTTNLKESLAESKICFIAVGTPMGEDGSADLQHVLAVAKSIGEHMQHYTFVVDKSTVPVGTGDKVREIIQEELDKRNSDLGFDVISNPEFLKEGAAVSDFMKPDRVVIGAESDRAIEVMRDLYAPFNRNHERIITMDVRSAEMTKYAANSMLATKISFMNEMANICERVGADVNQVRNGIGSDTRIGYDFIYPGCGYGGSCFPKDVQALVRIAEDVGYEPKILQSVEAVNHKQKKVLAEKVVQKFGEDLSGKTFAIWGLAFKPETDDMREASSITIIEDLTKRGAKIKAFDPKAMHESSSFYLKDNGNVSYVESKYDALNDSDGLLIVTEWKEFKSPDFEEIKMRLKTPVIFDGRNLFRKKRLDELGFQYYQIGVRMN